MYSFRASFVVLVLLSLCCLSSAIDVSHDGRALILNGQRKIIISGSIHYPRSTPEMWPELIQKAKEGGLNTIETYVFWNAHEPQRREYNFDGNLDLIRFLKEIQGAGLYAILRIGPYVCAEWNYGGFPIWLHQVPGMQMRTDNKDFKVEMQNFTTLIVNMVKEERLLAPQGGPILLTQIENEYHDAQSDYGEAGISYINWCAKMAESLDVGVPWIMCKQPDAPQPMINTCNGFYCDSFTPNNPNSPKIWTENWAGWFQAWGLAVPYRPAEDLAYSVAHFFQSGGTVHNYYMYHGGTNFGRTSGGPYITTSYDYDAPLDEYGNLRQPKWGHLKELHAAIKAMEKVLTNGEVTNTDLSNGALVTRYSTNGTSSGCFLTNTNSSYDVTVTFEGNQYFLPAWSISILPDCKQEIYNTAKVNAQTSIMVKNSNEAEDEPLQLSWSWRPEIITDSLKGKGSFTANRLIEQKMITADASDYLWYMTSVDMTKKDKMTLRVNTTGHGLYCFVNGRFVGSQYAPYDDNRNYTFVFEQAVTVNPGKNYITLLSVTVGLQNYKPHFDLVPVGILGPVELIGNGNFTKDLSLNKWSYKIGLNGEEKELYLEKSDHPSKWHSDMLPIRRRFTWYKTTFKAPLGTDPVVVDLQGMGKGLAWVNGQCIGRFWTNYTAPLMGCEKCDYRGNYDPSQCASSCGEPSQRWYHVPRSFLISGMRNTLVLFEEAGGNPSLVNFQTVTVGTTCASVPEGKTLNLSCQGSGTISEIQFASFGDPQSTCGSFEKGNCDADEARSVVEKACIGQTSCAIDVSEDMLGLSKCNANIVKRLAVQAVC